MTPTRRRSISLDHLGTLALALVLALIVWVVSVQQENPFENRTLNRVPVQARNLPENLVFTDSGTFSPVDVRIRAPRNVLETLTSRDIDAFVDLSNAQPGRQELPVTADPQVTNIEVLEVVPSAMVVRLEEKVQKSFPVIANVVDTPPFGYAAGEPEVTPAEVTVLGAASEVEKVRRAEVTVRLLNARSDVESTEFIILRDSAGDIVSGLDIEPRTVSVLVPVEQRQGFAEKSVLPRVEGQPAANHIITGIAAEPATVTLVGDPDTLAQMPPVVETIPIDIDGASEDIEERVPVIVPESVSIVAAQAVIVRIGIEPIEGSLTMTLEPIVQGLGQGLQIEAISPETIDVILRGPLPRLQALEADQNVRAVLDVANLSEGVYNLTPILVVPEDIVIQTVLPDTVQVTLIALPTPTPTQPLNIERFGASRLTPSPISPQTLTPTVNP